MWLLNGEFTQQKGFSAAILEVGGSEKGSPLAIFQAQEEAPGLFTKVLVKSYIPSLPPPSLPHLSLPSS